MSTAERIVVSEENCSNRRYGSIEPVAIINPIDIVLRFQVAKLDISQHGDSLSGELNTMIKYGRFLSYISFNINVLNVYMLW